MSDYFAKTPVRVPVKFVQGHWEYFYGGGVPVKEGALADLLVQKYSISDPKFLAALSKRTEHRMLDQGVALRVALSVRQTVEKELTGCLLRMSEPELSVEYYSIPRPAETRFVEIEIGPPIPKDALKRKDPVGGVWLTLEGGLPKGVVSSSVILPPVVSKKPLGSLNHAFTKLSEMFEPWRTSHTGNIYTRIFYQETDQKWYPLDRLRRAAEAKEEESIMGARWAEIAGLLSLGVIK